MNPAAAAPAATAAAEQVAHEWHLALGGPWGPALVVAGALAAVAAVALAAWSVRHERRRLRRWLPVALRAGAATTALVLFLQPTIRFEDVTRVPNHVAILVDASESMSLAERGGEPSRAQRTAALLAASRPLLDRWRAAHRLDFYTFGADLTPSTEATLTAPTAAAPRAPATRLREALGAVRARYEGRDLGGVVVISDGIDNGRFGAGELDADGQDFLRSLGAPVHGVWTGRTGLRDVAIARVLADDFAFARTAIKVEAIVRTSGAREAGWAGRRLPVVLRRNGQVVATSSVTVDPAAPDQKASFEFTPDRVGKYLYEVSTPVLEGEAIAENNARAFLLKVIRDKIRVLQVAGRPSWDERFLRGLLKHDPNVDLISFFILRTPGDVENVSPDEMSLIPFPTEELFLEQLRSFDVVFLQNFNFGPYGIGAYLGEIKRYVEEGGGLAMIGGDLSFTSGGYAHTPVADVLPVELLDERPAPELVSLDEVRPQLTAEGRSHPVTALSLGSVENARRWAALPPIEGVNLVARARPGATVLLAHPSLRGVDGRPLPVLAASDIGKGRALALTSDSSWRWGFAAAAGEARPLGASATRATTTDEQPPGGATSGDDSRGRAYQRFWDNAIRWLIRDPELRLLRVETDRTEYTRGEPVTVRVRARESDYRPAARAGVSLVLTRIGGAGGNGNGTSPGPGPGPGGASASEPPRTLKTDDEGGATLELGPLPPGGYRLVARRSPAPPGAPAALHTDEEVFVVRGAGREIEDVEARDRLLRAVASATGGRFRGPDETLEGLDFTPPRVVKVNRYREVELWSTWISLALAALLLGAEWTLRRRWGMA